MTMNDRCVYLDGLRGIAVLIVVLSHLSNVGYNSIFFDFSGIGKSGVYLFFVLSSYLLTKNIISKGGGFYTRKNLMNFFKRRFLRIYPLYFLVVVFSIVTTELFSEYLYGYGLPYKMDLVDGLMHLFLIRGDYVLWSIPVEVKYYFLLPLVAFLLVRDLYLGVASVLVLVLVSYFLFDYEKNSFEIGGYLSVFLIGSAFAALEKKIPRISERFAIYCFLFLMLVYFVSIPSLYTLIFQKVTFDFLHQYTIFWGGFWCAMIFLIKSSVASRMLSNVFFTEFGKISFSVYLLHMPIVHSIKFLLGIELVGLLITILLIVAISYLSYYVVEKNCL